MEIEVGTYKKVYLNQKTIWRAREKWRQGEKAWPERGERLEVMVHLYETHQSSVCESMCASLACWETEVFPHSPMKTNTGQNNSALSNSADCDWGQIHRHSHSRLLTHQSELSAQDPMRKQLVKGEISSATLKCQSVICIFWSFLFFKVKFQSCMLNNSAQKCTYTPPSRDLNIRKHGWHLEFLRTVP